MARRVVVLPYNPSWAEQFNSVDKTLRSILGAEVIAIHHIGSTAIPFTKTKPIIDILPEVFDINKINHLNDVMAQHGFQALGEYGLPGRRFFIKGSYEQHTHHVHIFQSGNPEIERHIAFRDYLNFHIEAAQEYGQLKQNLAQQYPDDIDAYIAGKNTFVKKLERRALAWRKSFISNDDQCSLHQGD